MALPFDLNKCVDVLRRTPKVLSARLNDFDKEWSNLNEGGASWSVYNVVGHLIHGEKTDWIPRLEIILNHGTKVPFTPFDREAMLNQPQDISLNSTLDEFAILRRENLQRLIYFNLGSEDLQKQGMHPELGVVTVEQLLASWVVHDLSHLSQVNRVLAHQWKEQTGPWAQYMGALRSHS